jgi:hypothetical protein
VSTIRMPVRSRRPVAPAAGFAIAWGSAGAFALSCALAAFVLLVPPAAGASGPILIKPTAPAPTGPAHALPATLAPWPARAMPPLAVHQLTDGIDEFDYVIPTGLGPFHQVGVHEVVRVRNGRPVPTGNALFMQHGDGWDFDAAFLGGTHRADSLPVYLARRGIDVWGIDLGWTLVPSSQTDFSFMQDWGLQRDLNDLETALGFARAIRAATGSPPNQLALLGWSRGTWIGYALLNEETQLPPSQRQVRAYIPVDGVYKTDDTTVQAQWCSLEAATNEDIANGIYAYDDTVYSQLGTLAESDPNGISPILGEPYTNLQASLLIGASTYQFGNAPTPFYHFVAGVFPKHDPNSVPTRLRYTTVARWDHFLEGISPFEPSPLIRDTEAITCGDSTGGFDNHLASITVPVFYVGSGGGFNTSGIYTLSLLGSADTSSHIVSFFPPSQAYFDFGHVDLFNATNAGDVVWAPMYSWLASHPG